MSLFRPSRLSCFSAVLLVFALCGISHADSPPPGYPSTINVTVTPISGDAAFSGPVTLTYFNDGVAGTGQSLGNNNFGPGIPNNGVGVPGYFASDTDTGPNSYIAVTTADGSAINSGSPLQFFLYDGNSDGGGGSDVFGSAAFGSDNSILTISGLTAIQDQSGGVSSSYAPGGFSAAVPESGGLAGVVGLISLLLRPTRSAL